MEYKIMWLFAFVTLFQVRTIIMGCDTTFGKISCTCGNDTLLCTGLQTESTDLVSIIVNISLVHYSSVHLENIVINVENMSLNFNSSFKQMKLQNLTLNSGLIALPETFFIEVAESLVFLNLQNNSFEDIPKNSLHSLHRLEDLDFSANHIITLHKNAFDGLKSLAVLKLDHNRIRSIDGEAFSFLENLEYLFLNSNDIEKLGITVFDNLHNLKFLSLSFNHLSVFEPETFTELFSLRKLVIDNNNFTSLEDIDFSSRSLVELSATNCSFQGPVENHHLQNVPNLESLDLSFNFLTSFEELALSSLQHLKILNVSYNQVRKLADKAFASLVNLEELNLGNNILFLVRTQAFYNLTQLISLDLRHNRFEAFICQYTSDLLALQQIYLQGNPLRTINAGTFMHSPNLKHIKMHDDRLNCTCSLSVFAEYLLNSTTIDKMDIASITCFSPPASVGISVIHIDYTSMKCPIPTICSSPALSAMEDDEYEYETPVTTSEASTLSETSVASTVSETSVASTVSETSIISTVSEPSIANTVSETSIATTTSETSVTSTLGETSVTTTTSEISVTSTVGETSVDNTVSETSITSTVSEPSIASTVSETSIASTTSETSVTSTIDETSVASTVRELSVTSTISETSIASTDNETSVAGMSGKTFETNTVNETSEAITTPFTTDSYITPTTTENLYGSSPVSFPTSTVQPLTTPQITDDIKILIKNHSYIDGTLCLDWIMNGSLPSDSLQCILLYTYPTPNPSSVLAHHESYKKTPPFKCLAMSNELQKKCLKIFKVDMLYQFCMKIYKKATRELLVDSCVTYNEKSTTILTTTTIPPFTTSAIPPFTTSAIPPFTTTAIPPFTTTTTSFSPTTTPLSTTTSPLSTSVISSSTTTSPPTITTSTLPSTIVPLIAIATSFMQSISKTTAFAPKSFNITYVHFVFVNKTALKIDWKVKRKESAFVCQLALEVFNEDINHTRSLFPCADRTQIISGLEKDVDYKVCLTAYHITFGVIPVCFPVYTPSQEFSIQPHSQASFSSLPMIILIGLLIVVILIVILLAARTILRKPRVTDRYNVSEEEKRVQRRENRQSNTHSVRYSYTANETLEA